ETRLEDERIAVVLARHAGLAVPRRDLPAAMLIGAEQGGEAGIGIEPRPAQPIDRAVARHQRSRLTVADQRVVFNARWHGGYPKSNMTKTSRPNPGSQAFASTLGSRVIARHTPARRIGRNNS